MKKSDLLVFSLLGCILLYLYISSNKDNQEVTRNLSTHEVVQSADSNPSFWERPRIPPRPKSPPPLPPKEITDPNEKKAVLEKV